MKNFIIDEMIIRECHSLKDADGNENFDSLDFITSFIQSDHKVGLNGKIEKKYRDYQKSIKQNGEFVSPQASKIINRILRSDKKRETFGIPGNYKPIRTKKCDAQFVGVAIQLNGILVTNDQPLIDSIISQNLNSQFTTVKVNDAKNQL